MYTCPKGCQSFDADYCSECGARIAGAPNAPPLVAVAAAPSPANPASGALTLCPDCAAERIPSDAVFCELCRYNFATGQSCGGAEPAPAIIPVPVPLPPPVPVAADVAAPEAPPAPAAVAANNGSSPPAAPEPKPAPAELLKLEVLVTADATRFASAPNAVAGAPLPPERVFPLDLAELLIGRRSDTKDIHPEIPLNDDAAVSHRHAKLLRLPDGGFALLDLGSANGTSLNDVDLLPGVRTPLKPGDAIQLGRWSVLTICAVK